LVATNLPQWFAFTNALADLGGKLGRVSRICQFNFFLFRRLAPTRTARPKHLSFVCDASEPIENGADRPLNGVGIIALEPVQETASDQPIDIGLRHLDRETPEAALPTLAEPRHPDCAGSLAAPI
jgi:hypothetical protein